MEVTTSAETLRRSHQLCVRYAVGCNECTAVQAGSRGVVVEGPLPLGRCAVRDPRCACAGHRSLRYCRQRLDQQLLRGASPVRRRRSSAPSCGWSSNCRRASRRWSTRPGWSTPTVNSDASPTRPECAVTRLSTPAARAAAVNRSPIICADSGTTRSRDSGLVAARSGNCR